MFCVVLESESELDESSLLLSIDSELECPGSLAFGCQGAGGISEGF